MIPAADTTYVCAQTHTHARVCTASVDSTYFRQVLLVERARHCTAYTAASCLRRRGASCHGDIGGDGHGLIENRQIGARGREQRLQGVLLQLWAESSIGSPSTSRSPAAAGCGGWRRSRTPCFSTACLAAENHINGRGVQRQAHASVQAVMGDVEKHKNERTHGGTNGCLQQHRLCSSALLHRHTAVHGDCLPDTCKHKHGLTHGNTKGQIKWHAFAQEKSLTGTRPFHSKMKTIVKNVLKSPIQKKR